MIKLSFDSCDKDVTKEKIVLKTIVNVTISLTA